MGILDRLWGRRSPQTTLNLSLAQNGLVSAPAPENPTLPLTEFDAQPSEQAPELGRIFHQRVIDRWVTLTEEVKPEVILRVLSNAEAGSISDYVALCEQIEERDLVIAGAINTRKLAIQGVPTETTAVSPKDKSRKALAEEIASDCREMLESLYNWPDTEFDMLHSILIGTTIAEIDYGPGGRPFQVRYIDARRYQGDWTTNRLLVQPDEPHAAPIPIADYPNKFLVHRHKTRTAGPFAGGMGRILLWPSMFRKYGLKDWLVYNEVFAMPLRIGKLPRGWQARDAKLLEAALKKIGSDGSGVISDGAEIEFVTVNGTTVPYQTLNDHLANEVEMYITGKERQRQATTVGQFHYSDAVRQDLLESDCSQWGSTVRHQLFRPYVVNKYGAENADLTPYYAKRYEQPRDLVQMSTVASTLFKPVAEGGLGLAVKRAVIYDLFSFPEPDEDTPDEDLLFPRAVLTAPKPDANARPGDAQLNPKDVDAEPEDLDAAIAAAAEKAATLTGDERAEFLREQAYRLDRMVIAKSLHERFKGAATTKDQRTLDEFADDVARKGTAAAAPIIEEIEDLLRDSTSLEDFERRVRAKFSDLPTRKLEAHVAKAIFVADLFGRYAVKTDADRKKKD